MARMRILAIVGVLGFMAGSTATFSQDWAPAYVALPGWCPGNGCAGANLQAQHQSWHSNFSGGREFPQFHRELLAWATDYRLYSAVPAPAVFAVLPQPGSLLEFPHTGRPANGFVRPALHAIDTGPSGSAHADPGGVSRDWPVRPANLTLGNATFFGYTEAQFGSAIDGMFHGNGHMSIATHDSPIGAGDMGDVFNATRDPAFYQWHGYIDIAYSDWAVGKYQMPDKSGVPIYFSVRSTAVGTAGSALTDRRGSNVYQGNTAILPATQYGAIPRIPSDIYVGDNNSSNLLYTAGVRQWNTLNAWDIDAWSVLNPAGSGFYFSATMASAGVAATPIAVEKGAGGVIGGDVWETGGGGTHTKYRAETAIGLAGAPATTDELDAVEVDQQRRVQGTNDTLLPGVYDRPKQFFSLRSGSTFGVKSTLGVLIGPSDILKFGTKGELEIAVLGTVLGLGAGDDLDALAIVDVAPLDTLTAADRIYYSLAAGSPALGADSAADIFCHTVAGVTCGAVAGRLEMAAATLGLLAGDDLDALDIRGTATTGACCVPGSGCSNLTASACTTAGGTFSGLGTLCSATSCPVAGACCNPNGTCSQTNDQACLASLPPGVFQGAGVACGSVTCPFTPNDECANAYAIPYARPDYYEPPAAYENNTYAYTSDYDPPYSCHDHEVFFPEYGSGTIWYSYDVPPGGSCSLYLDTYQTLPNYPYAGGAGDTRLAIYYAPNGDCSVLQEVACGDNAPGEYSPNTYYAAVGYDPPAPTPGRYYVQLSTVGDANRGTVRLAVKNTAPVATAPIPALDNWGIAVLVLLFMVSMWIMIRRRNNHTTSGIAGG